MHMSFLVIFDIAAPACYGERREVWDLWQAWLPRIITLNVCRFPTTFHWVPLLSRSPDERELRKNQHQPSCRGVEDGMCHYTCGSYIGTCFLCTMYWNGCLSRCAVLVVWRFALSGTTSMGRKAFRWSALFEVDWLRLKLVHIFIYIYIHVCVCWGFLDTFGGWFPSRSLARLSIYTYIFNYNLTVSPCEVRTSLVLPLCAPLGL